MPSSHGLRTTGTHTGNFGRARVQGKRESLDLSDKILKKDSLKIPTQAESFARLQTAFELTTDPKLKRFLSEQLAKYRAKKQLYATTVIAGGTPVTPVDSDLDPKGRFKDSGTHYSTTDQDSVYNYIHRLR